MKKQNSQLDKVALRFQCIYVNVDRNEMQKAKYKTSNPLFAFVKRLAECGYSLSEESMHALSTVSVSRLVELTETINNVYRLNLNWTPLVKGWDTPTGEGLWDHLVTSFANLDSIKKIGKGITLPCGHLIPNGTFHLERYNGCPFCGTPFTWNEGVYKGHGSKLRELALMTEDDMHNLLVKLLVSPVPLDATQFDSLKLLLEVFDVPEKIEIAMKQNIMAVVESLVAKGLVAEAGSYFSTPQDVLRFLWYQKTGHAEVIRPKSIIAAAKQWRGILPDGPYKKQQDLKVALVKKLKLKFDRKTCRMVAGWINNMEMDSRRMAENMHPYRQMWVRFIRALRLAEYAKKTGFAHLAELMDVFYKQDYPVWNGMLDSAVISNDRDKVLSLLQTRPGLFARSLFATMLRFGTTEVLKSFRKVALEVPARLVMSLMNTSENYFDISCPRYVSSKINTKTKIGPNPLLFLYSEDERKDMIEAARRLYLDIMHKRFELKTAPFSSIYIAPCLYDIPIGVGDRATTVQDASCALQGTRFALEGDKVRLFLQWGVGLPAQHLDMDLSARIYFDKHWELCYYGNLTTTGAKHSGDIRSIPDKVGTAEYVELDLVELDKAGAQYVAFITNAYSDGKLPELVVGWMDSANPMKISNKTGVAYDPSCVQHIVRITDKNMSKGMTFGLLDVKEREITWLELPNQNQAAFQGDANTVMAFLNKLRHKVSAGELLETKAKAQKVTIVENMADAQKAYTYEWALNPVNIAELLQ